MSKATNTEPKISGAQVNAGLVLGGEMPQGVNFEQAFDIMMSDNASLKSLSTEYFKFESKGVYGFIVEKIDTTEMQGKTIEVVHLRNKEGVQFINGDKVLVGACKRLKQLPAFIKVEYKGDIQNKQGKYKDLEVKTFAVEA